MTRLLSKNTEIPDIDQVLECHFDYLRETGWEETVDEQGNVQWEQNDSENESESETETEILRRRTVVPRRTRVTGSKPLLGFHSQ